MKKYITIMAAFTALVNLAGAAVITFPNLSSGGSFTLDAGDVTTNTANANIADQATAVLNINGDWHHGVYEVQLGGVNYHATQDVTLNIGSSGSATWGSAWIGDGVPYGGTVVIDIATGGKMINDGSGFGTRPHATNGNWTASWSDLWDAGMLKRDGLGKADLTAGVDDAFLSNFTLAGSIASAHTLTAIAPSTNTFVHPGIGLTIADLNHIKANLAVEPWATGYADLQADSDVNYVMNGPFAEVTHRKAGTGNGNQWAADMTAMHNLARMWYMTDDSAYAQKARDILIDWANTHTNFAAGETYLEMGYNAQKVFEGADILRSTWPGWTTNDTATCKTYFENVWWDQSHIAVPNPLRSANQGMSQFAAALGTAVFLDDEIKFNQCLEVFRTDAPAALLSSLPNGQVGDTGRDAHDQGQLKLMAWAAEVFWDQGVDVFSEYDNRLLAAAEYISRYNLLLDPAFIQAGTVYDIYPEAHTFEGVGPDYSGPYNTYAMDTSMINLLHTAYVVRKGMRAPHLEQYLTYTTQDADSFCYYKTTDSSTATNAAALPAGPTVASVTNLVSVNMGDAANGGASYNAGSKTWTVNGRGTRMWYSSVPDYRFAYLQVTGDATIIAKLTGLSGGSTQDARAGLVFSSDLTDSADMQAIVVTNPNGSDPQTYSFRRGDIARSHQDNDGSRTYPRQANPKVPYWFKIERIGNRVNCYSSPDGASWSCGESADYAVGATAYFGLAVSSDQFGSTATATFTDVRITGGDGGEAIEVPEAPFAIYASPGGDQVPLRWLESFEADGYKIWRSTKSGGPYTLITEQSGTSFIDTNVVVGTHYYYKVSATNAMGESARSEEGAFAFPDTDYYEGEDYDAQSGVGTENARDFFGGKNLSNISSGDWCRYDGITLGTGAVFRARLATYNADYGKVEVRLDGTGGTLIGTLEPADTGGAQSWGTFETNLVDTVGTHDIYLVFTSGVSNGPSLNLNWFDIVYAHVSEFDIGMDRSLTYDASTNKLTNFGGITAWDSTSTHLKLADGSDLSTLDLTQLGVTSWATLDFDDVAKTTIWGGAKLSGITLYTDGNFGAGDNFTGADFSNIIWGNATSTADAGKFFSGGSGATSAADRENAITFAGADLSLISGAARTVMINNLGGFFGSTPIGAQFDDAFITNSGWDKAALIAAGWQHEARLLVDTATYAIESPPAFSTSDLAQTEYLSSLGTGTSESVSEHATLFNGTIGNDDGDTTDSGEVRMYSGDTIKVTFDTSVNTNGYDLTGITTVFGWNTAANGRSNQGYELILTYIDNSTATLAGPTHWEPNSPANYWTKVSFVDEDGGVLESDAIVHNGNPSAGNGVRANGVKSVTFNISNNANAGSWVCAREFDIFGVPTVYAVESEQAEFLPGVSVSNGNFIAQFTGTVGGHYRVEYTDDLTGTNAWQTVTDLVSLATSPFEFSTPATNYAEFYRVINMP